MSEPHSVETILATWHVMGSLIRKEIERRNGPFWASPIYPSVAAFKPDTDSTIIAQIKFEMVKRAGIRVIEGDGIMVAPWS